MRFHPLTPARWGDFERLFGPNGACGGCWCMFRRQSRSEYDANHGEPNRKAMRAIVASGEVPGILGYRDGRPVGWCAVAPREAYASLNRSPVLKPIDDQPVWSLVCFYIAKEYRRQNLMAEMLQGAIDHVKSQGGRIIEAYPTVAKRKLSAMEGFMGFAPLYTEAGFKRCAAPSKARWIMRYTIGG